MQRLPAILQLSFVLFDGGGVMPSSSHGAEDDLPEVDGLGLVEAQFVAHVEGFDSLRANFGL